MGVPRTQQSNRNQWLGLDRRTTELKSGVIAMGKRTYLPQIGRFLQVDPVQGGSANRYDYVNQDPVNSFDLNGEMCAWRCIKKFVKKNFASVRHPNRYAKIGAFFGIVGIGCGVAALYTGGTALIPCVEAAEAAGAVVGIEEVISEAAAERERRRRR
jgi:RHS repeat-associated protein